MQGIARRVGAVLALGIVAGATPAAAVETYEIDPVHSTVLVRVKHLNVSYVYVRFDDLSGGFQIDREQPEKSRVEVTIQVASVDTRSEKRDKHLRSPDFLHAKRYPTIQFRSTTVERLGDTRGRLTGDLTLHGVTRRITFEMEQVGEGTDPWGGYRMGFAGQTTLHRSDFGMDFMLGGIGDEVTLILGVEGIRR